MDINYDRRECNDVDPAEMLMCIQAWHEMINPGHHYLELFSDGSGIVRYAVNSPKVYKVPLSDRDKYTIIKFSSLQDFINQTKEALEKEGCRVVDSFNDSTIEGNK